MKKAESRFRGLMLVSSIMAVIDVIVGAVLALYLDLSTHLCTVIIGTVVLLHGLFYLIRFLYDGFGKDVFSINIINAVGCIILGLFVIFFDFPSTVGIGISYGVYLLFSAFEIGFFGYKLRKAEDSSYPIMIVMALLSVVMAVIVAWNPFSANVLSTKLAGIFMLCSGVFGAMICKLFFDKSKTLLKMFK